MKNWNLISLMIILLALSCKSSDCTKNLFNYLNLNALSVWETETKINISHQKNVMLLSHFEAAEKDSISIFERNQFLKDVSKFRELNIYKFHSLFVLEVKSSGERYRNLKYLIISCEDETSVIEFQLNERGWDIIHVHKFKTMNIGEDIKLIMDRNESDVYWGNNITDIIALSDFRGYDKISTEVFGNLSKKQYDALSRITK